MPIRDGAADEVRTLGLEGALKDAVEGLLVAARGKVLDPSCFSISRGCLETAHLAIVMILDLETSIEEKTAWLEKLHEFRSFLTKNADLMARKDNVSVTAVMLHIRAMESTLVGMPDPGELKKALGLGVRVGAGLVKSALTMSIDSDLLQSGLQVRNYYEVY